MNGLEEANKIMKAKNLYNIFNLQKDCLIDDIESSYRQIAPILYQHITGKANQNNEETTEVVNEAFQVLSYAYQILLSANLRKSYHKMFPDQNNSNQETAKNVEVFAKENQKDFIQPEQLYSQIIDIPRGSKKTTVFIAYFCIISSIYLLKIFYHLISTDIPDVSGIIRFDQPLNNFYFSRFSKKYNISYQLPTWWIQDVLFKRFDYDRILNILDSKADDFWVLDLQINCAFEKNDKFDEHRINCKKLSSI